MVSELQKITQDMIDDANRSIDEQCDFRNLDKADQKIRMAVALDNIWSIGYDYDGYENSIVELRGLIDYFVAISLATEYWKILAEDKE